MSFDPADLTDAVARVAEALDDLRAGLGRVDRLVRDQQDRIVKLYPLPSDLEASPEDSE